MRLVRIIVVLLALVPGAALGQQAAPRGQAAPLAASQAQAALEVLRDDRRRAELIATLEAIARAGGAVPTQAAPAVAPPVAPAVATAPVPPAATPPAPAPSAPTLEPGSLGAQFVAQMSVAMSEAGAQLVASLQAVNDLPLLGRWLADQVTNPEAGARDLDALWRIAAVMLAALAVEWGVRLVLRRVRESISRGAQRGPAPPPVPEPEASLESAQPEETAHSARQRRLSGALNALRRLPYLLGRLLLDVTPIGAGGVAGQVLAGTDLGEPTLTRLAIMTVLYAYVAARLALALAAMLYSPLSPRLRLFQVSEWAADFLTRWTWRVVVLVATAFALAHVGLLFGMYRSAFEALIKLFSLVLHGFLVVAVLQARVPVAKRIHARPDASGAWAAILNRVSEIWHLVAIFYIVALWLVWAVELQNGYSRLVHFFVVTVGVTLLSRLASVVLLGGLERLRAGPEAARRHPGLEARMNAYAPLVRSVLLGVIALVTSVALLEGWGFGVIGWFQYTGLGGRALSAVTLIGFTVVVAVLLWEGVNAAIELHVTRLVQAAQLARAGRLRTLLPMLRTVLMVTIVLVVALMSLSELGVNIAPLLAGAGVVGIAVGFGSQKLVQDLITGLFLLLENAMQVGDVVTLGGLSGTVEALSIRTIRLRALDGSVHIIPFSAVTTVTNQTRDYSYALLDVSVGLNEEPGHIEAVLRDVAQAMQAEEAWSDVLLAPLEVMGVEKFVDLAWIMRVRIKTLPTSRWRVARELNRRIKERFDELAIESPITSHRVLSTNPPPPAQAVPAPGVAPVPTMVQAGESREAAA